MSLRLTTLGLLLRAFMKGRERGVAALFEDMRWEPWDGALVNLHVTKLELDGPAPL
jgi:hypothetical protein